MPTVTLKHSNFHVNKILKPERLVYKQSLLTGLTLCIYLNSDDLLPNSLTVKILLFGMLEERMTLENQIQSVKCDIA